VLLHGHSTVHTATHHQQSASKMAVVSLDLSFASPLFYFCLGICVALYALMVLKKDHKKKISEFESNSIVKFYLNIFVQNKEEALSNVIKAKMANKFIAGEIAGCLACADLMVRAGGSYREQCCG
jgi:hypothetical protein